LTHMKYATTWGAKIIPRITSLSVLVVSVEPQQQTQDIQANDECLGVEADSELNGEKFT